MTWRLVLGVVYTQRWSLLYMAVMIGFMSRLELAGRAVVLIAVVAGVQVRGALAKRELAPLPVSPGELRRAEWLLSALVPLALLTVGRCLGWAWHAVTTDVGWAFPASPVRVIFDALYLGLIAAWLSRTPEQHEPDYPQDPQLLRRVALIFAMMAAPFIVVPRLPLALGEVSALLWICAILLLGVALVPLVRPRSVYQRPSARNVSPETPPLPARLRPPTPVSRFDRIEGIWVPMRGVVGQAMWATVVTIAFLAIVQHIVGVVTIWWPFDSSMTDLRFLTTIGLPLMFFIGLCPSLAPWIGSLKRMPVSSRRAALFLSLAPTTMPIVFWAGLLVVHLLAAAQAPTAMRPGLLAAFIGLVALIDALGTKSGSPLAKFAIGCPVLFAFTYGTEENRALVQAVLTDWGLPLAGALCLSLAWVVNFHTLTRSLGSARAFQTGRPTHTVGAR